VASGDARILQLGMPNAQHFEANMLSQIHNSNQSAKHK
jgi:hypothetical protein